MEIKPKKRLLAFVALPLTVWYFGLFKPVQVQAQSYNLTNYTTNSGLPGNQINDLLQDRHGRLWVGTMNGLAVFNGEKFTKFEKSSPISNSPIKAVFEDSEGSVWAGMLRKGVCRINGAGQTFFRKSDGLIGDDIHAIAQDRKGNIWFGTSVGLSRYDGKRFSNYTTTRGLVNDHVNAMLVDSKGRLWVATMDGVSMFNGDKITNYKTSDGLSSNICFSIHEDSNGIIRVGTYQGVSLLNRNNRFVTEPNQGLLVTERIEDIFGGGKSPLAIASYNSGFYLMGQGGEKSISMKNGLPSNIVKSILKDREGSYWIGTWSGLTKWKSDKLTIFTHEDGLSNNNLLSIASDSKGRVYFGTLTGGFSVYENGSINTIGPENGLKGFTVWSIAIDSTDRVWLGTDAGPAVYDHTTGKVTHPLTDLSYLTVYAVDISPAGNLAWGTDDGIYLKSSKGDIIQMSKQNGLTDTKIRSLCFLNDDVLIAGTTTKLFLIQSGSVKELNSKIGLKANQVTSVSIARGDFMIVTTYGDGVFILNKEQNLIKKIGTQQGLSNDNTLSGLVDSKNQLWIGTTEGFDVIEFEKIIRNEVYDVRHYNKSNGFTGAETNSISEDILGNVWFATVNGSIKFPSNQTLPQTVLPIIHITSVSLLLKDTDWKNKKISPDSKTGLPANLILPYNNNHITFNFEGTYLMAPDEVRYQYFLEGFQDSWAPVSSRSVATYSNLDAGSYTFKVRSSADGFHWTDPVTYSFVIKPPFWKTTFFYILYVVFGAGLFIGFTKWRTLYLERKGNVLVKLVDERTHELNEKNQELEKLSLVASETDNSVLIFGPDGQIEWVNEGFTKLTGYTMEELVLEKGGDISQFTFNPSASEILRICAQEKRSEIFESQFITKNGELKFISNTLSPVIDELGNVTKFVVIDTDITIRKNMEERIRESLEEKGMLLREIHHRVKNNLQIIISLFNLQSHYVNDKKALLALKEGQDRIKSMALIHERFYQNDGLSKIDFDDYIKRLVENLLLSSGIKPGRIKTQVEADKISLDIDTAVPCGLIINELVSNSLKHAFGESNPGTLSVSLRYISDNMVRLIVSDDGIGLPDGFDIEKYDSLGMQLINALSNQLDGKLTLNPGKGTTFTMDFKVPTGL
ncbi:MAG: two-component regulator propeller domain-containing protein [Bacteroidota bacterium]